MKLNRWFQSIPKSVHMGVVILLVAVVMGQFVSNSRLGTEVARFQASVNALLRERAVLIDDVQAWKTEAVEYRVKYGEPEPSSDPPIINESEREIIYAPSGE